MNVLVIAAHPDDEVLGCGGTIARLASKTAIYIAILGEGHTSREYQGNAKPDTEKVTQLREMSEKAAAFLGAKDLFMYDLPDNRFDTLPLLDVVKIIESLIEKIKPSVVYTHHGGDLNIDHTVTFKATLTAARPLKDTEIKSIYTYEVPSATEWAFGGTCNQFEPNVFMDITKTLETKIIAMNFYQPEMRISPHPRSAESLRALATWRGSTAGLHAAEAFELIRQIK